MEKIELCISQGCCEDQMKKSVEKVSARCSPRRMGALSIFIKAQTLLLLNLVTTEDSVWENDNIILFYSKSVIHLLVPGVFFSDQKCIQRLGLSDLKIVKKTDRG